MSPRRGNRAAPSHPARPSAHSNAWPTLATLNNLSAQKVSAWFRAPSTLDAYKRYVKEGRRWVEQWAAGMQEVERSSDAASHEDDDASNSTGADTAALALAFDNINEYTPRALHAFVVYKCEIEGCSYKTAEGIRSAFKNFFTYTHQCQGDYWRKNSTGRWEGNPVFDLSYSAYHDSIKKEYQRTGESAHSLPMLPKDIEKMFKYADEAHAAGRLSKTHVLFWKAFSALAFTLWTRCDEAIKLQQKDLQMDLDDPVDGVKFHRFTLLWRKTNQDNPDKGNDYDIPDCQDVPDFNCYQHVSEWIAHLESEMQRPLGPDDYLFPALATTGKLKVGTPTSRSEIEKLLDHFVAGAGLLNKRSGKFTTHCFRRGGAQWCFMWRPDGKWSLKAVKWWGGWAPSETVGTLTRYLLDEVSKYEHGFGDMLMPSRNHERHVTFMGGPQRTTSLESDPSVRMVLNELCQQQQHLETMIQQLSSHLRSATLGPRDISSDVHHLSEHDHDVPMDSPEEAAAPDVETEIATPDVETEEVAAYDVETVVPSSPYRCPAVNVATRMLQHPCPQIRQPEGQPQVPLCPPDPVRTPIAAVDASDFRSRQDPSKWRIPNTHSLKDCLRYWHDGDERQALLVPLKQWPQFCKPSRYRSEAVKWGRIQRVVDEFEKVCSGDEAVFRAKYPGLADKYTKLYKAIDAERKRRNECRPRRRRDCG